MNSDKLTIADIRRMTADLPGECPVIIRNESSEWYGFDAVSKADIKTMYSYKNASGATEYTDQVPRAESGDKVTEYQRFQALVIDF